MATATKMVMMGTARMKWLELERKRQKMKRESDGVIVTTMQQLTIKKNVRGRDRERDRETERAKQLNS